MFVEWALKPADDGVGDLGADFRRGVALLGVEHDERHAGRVADGLQKGVACLARFVLMGSIVQLDDAQYGQRIRVADDKIEMLAADPVEGALPVWTPQTLARVDDIGNAHFGEYPILMFGNFVEDAEEGAFGRREKRIEPLIGQRVVGPGGAQARKDKKDDQDDECNECDEINPGHLKSSHSLLHR